MKELNFNKKKTFKMKVIGTLGTVICLAGLTNPAFATDNSHHIDKWSFGVISDTQWTKSDDGYNPNTVAANIIAQIDQKFIEAGAWANAVEMNYGGTPVFISGPWQVGYTLGTYGVDPHTGTAWAVINFDGAFAIDNRIVPGPNHWGHWGHSKRK